MVSSLRVILLALSFLASGIAAAEEESPAETTAAARAVISSLAPTLPPGVRLTIARDESEDLAKQLNDLLLRGAIAFGAVFLVLIVTMRSLPGASLVLGSATGPGMRSRPPPS